MDVKPGPVYSNADEVDTVSTAAADETCDATTFRLPDGIDRICEVTVRSHFDDHLRIAVDRNES